MRATGDYRIYSSKGEPTLLETREWFRARVSAIGSHRAWNELKLSDDHRRLPDWSRIANEGQPSVELGHQLLRSGVPAEWNECAQVFAEENGRPLGEAKWVEALNVRPTLFVPGGTGSPSKRIIGWGRWAAFLQRHLCHTLVENFAFMETRWSVHDEAVAFRGQADERFGSLRLYPFVRRLNATDEVYYRAAQDGEMALIMQSPEDVPAAAWNYICYTVPFCALYIPPPHAFVNEWHLHNPPPGTAYNPLPRLNHPSLVEQPDTIQRLERLHRLAPYDATITHNLLRLRDRDQQTPAALTAAYDPILDFNPMPSRRIARLNAGNPAEFERWMRRAASLDSSDFLDLAQFYEKNGSEHKAAEAYIQWLADEPDEVIVANQVSFLVRYFEKLGQTDDATALAERGAATFSRGGLLAKAQLLEQRGQFDAALGVCQKLHERYDDPGLVLGLLHRAQRAKPNPHYATLEKNFLRETIGGPLQIFPTSPSSLPPKRGVIVHLENKAIRDAGLRENDIIVAVRGYRADSWRSFKLLRGMEPDTPFSLKVWRNEAYLDLPPLPAATRFGVDLKDYSADNATRGIHRAFTGQHAHRLDQGGGSEQRGILPRLVGNRSRPGARAREEHLEVGAPRQVENPPPSWAQPAVPRRRSG